MNLRLWTALAAGVAAIAAARADDYAFKEPFAQTGAFAPNGSLSLENVNGNVEIRTWARNEIRIEGEKSALTAEELKAVDLTIDLSEQHAAIRVRLPKRGGRWFSDNTIRAAVRFEITVPATAILDRIVDVNGRVTIAGLRGEARVETVNGGIHGTDLGGPARLRSVNGQINVTLAQVVAGQELALATVNGSITIALPKDAGVALRAAVVNGHIDCEFPLALTTSAGRQNLHGTIGDGRASLSAETVNGSIRIQQR